MHTLRSPMGSQVKGTPDNMPEMQKPLLGPRTKGEGLVFVCQECVKNYEVKGDLELFLIMGSYGPCEDCGKSRKCYDLPHNSYMVKAK